MVLSTLFTVQMLAFVQKETPRALIGKIIACLLALNLCAQPIGQALYGLLFEQLAALPWVIIIGAALVSCVIALLSRQTFSSLANSLGNQPLASGDGVSPQD